MNKRKIINPLTRISGFAEIDVMIDDHKVKDAKTKGFLFRGFEKMLKGRPPFDAVYFTQRICGICSTAHSMASSMALEDALQIKPAVQGRFLRDFLHGCEFLQNHIRHFYQYTLPDFVKLPAVSTLYSIKTTDYRLPSGLNEKIAQNYFESLTYSRKAHQMLATLGGKVPHNQGVFIGGVTTQPSVDIIIKVKSLLSEIRAFIENKMLPDVYIVAEYYPECFEMGKSYGNFLSYGCFDNYKGLGTLYLDAGVYKKGILEPFTSYKITENIDFSWYDGGPKTYQPFEGNSEAAMEKPGAYSFVKAPRYEGLPFEVGPLARQWLSGAYRKGISTMDRTIARVLEAKKIAEIMDILLQNIVPDFFSQKKYDKPHRGQGQGLLDTTRGALGHWLKIEEGGIGFYQIITPTAWNFSTRDDKYRGVTEQALIGASVANLDDPVEVGRIVRSFDPCISCATHLIDMRTVDLKWCGPVLPN